MYTHQEERSVESVCYQQEHIQEALEVIQEKFNHYFQEFIEHEAGYGISEKRAKEIANSLGMASSKNKNKIDTKLNFNNIINNFIGEFEKDRKKYIEIFDEESLEEYEEDSSMFKSIVLRNECPIIHSTLHSNAKELDKYKKDFNCSDAEDLITVISNLFYFSKEYYNEIYDKNGYEQIDNYEALKMSDLDTEDYSVYGVIGGGIRSHMLYKVCPEVFSNRSRNALWAMWYLTDKEIFDCEYDSEFLMIDKKKDGYITQQNYFYPYELFSFYAFKVYLLLKQKAIENGVYLNPEYRYVIVDAFLSFIANQHNDEISLLKQNIKNGGYGYGHV